MFYDKYIGFRVIWPNADRLKAIRPEGSFDQNSHLAEKGRDNADCLLSAEPCPYLKIEKLLEAIGKLLMQLSVPTGGGCRSRGHDVCRS